VFCACFYGNRARRLRFEKLCCLDLSRSTSGPLSFKPLLDPGGGFRRSETAVSWRFRGGFGIKTAKKLEQFRVVRNGHFSTDKSVHWSANGHATAVAKASGFALVSERPPGILHCLSFFF
jgi:hypothetical protein